MSGKYPFRLDSRVGLEDAVLGVDTEAGVPKLRGLELPRVRCFAACLLVDHGRSLLAFCMTNERALRRDVFAADASTKRNSC